MTTPALDTANAATVVAPARLIRVDFPSSVTVRWSTASAPLTRASDGTYHSVDDTYGTLTDVSSIKHSISQHTAMDLTIHATPALVAILRSQGATRSRVRVWDVAADLSTGALIDTDIPDFDGWVGERPISFDAQGATARITCVARSIRADDPDQSALMNDATQTRYLGTNADLFFQYAQVLPETLPWGTAASNINAPPRQGDQNFTPAPGDFYFPGIQFS